MPWERRPDSGPPAWAADMLRQDLLRIAVEIDALRQRLTRIAVEFELDDGQHVSGVLDDIRGDIIELQQHGGGDLLLPAARVRAYRLPREHIDHSDQTRGAEGPVSETWPRD